MKLTFEQIKSIAFGYVKIWEEPDGVHFTKSTQKQIDAWYTQNNTLGAWADLTTGVRLDFHTNSSFFQFKAAAGKNFEVYCDGLLTGQYGKEGASLQLDPSNESHRITLYLPSHDSSGILSVVSLEDGAFFKPHIFDKKILFIGDSITQGWNSGYDSLSYAHRVARSLNADCIIQGIGGSYYFSEAFDKLNYNPDIVIIAFGTNDFGHFKYELEPAREQAEAYLSQLEVAYPGAKLYGISPIPRLDYENKPERAQKFSIHCQMIKDALSKYHFTLIDGDHIIPKIKDFYADDVHPNALGFGIYAEKVLEALK